MAREPRTSKLYQKSRVKAFLIPKEPQCKCTPYLEAVQGAIARAENAAFNPLLLDAGATIDAKDMHGDSPLTWASWHLRPASILRMLCHGDFHIHPNYGGGMEANLRGKPHV